MPTVQLAERHLAGWRVLKVSISLQKQQDGTRPKPQVQHKRGRKNLDYTVALLNSQTALRRLKITQAVHNRQLRSSKINSTSAESESEPHRQDPSGVRASNSVDLAALSLETNAIRLSGNNDEDPILRSKSTHRILFNSNTTYSPILGKRSRSLSPPESLMDLTKPSQAVVKRERKRARRGTGDNFAPVQATRSSEWIRRCTTLVLTSIRTHPKCPSQCTAKDGQEFNHSP